MKLGTYAIEQDYSQYVAKSSEVILGIVGTATKGPINTPTVCTSPQDLTNKFGVINPDCLGLYAGQYFLSQSSKLWYVRAASSTAAKAIANVSGLNDSDVPVEDALVFEAKSEGSYYNGYQVVVSEVVVDAETSEVSFTISVKNKATTTVETIKNIKFSSLTKDSVVVPEMIKSNYVTLSAVSATATSVSEGAYVLDGGSDGIENISSAEYNTAMETLNNDNIDINLLAIPGVSDAAVVDATLKMAENRGDCLYIVDAPNNTNAEEVAQWHNGEGTYTTKLNSSYGAAYWSWQKIYDSVNKIYIEVPPSVPVVAAIARSVNMSEIWYAPAGLQRGLISGVISPVVAPTSSERDMLYSGDNSINCIINDPQVGLCIFGQKTLSRENSALNRVNVRMLLNYIKRIVVAACRHLTFEPNDRITWNYFEDKIEPTLRGIKDHRGLYEYRIVKGETIVTDNDIDNYRMPCMILLRPTKAAEEIPIYFTITSTGADFNDVMESNGIITEDY